MAIDKTLTEQKIQRVLSSFMASPKYLVDGLFVFGWESDKLIWTKAGYIYEFEIKISHSDYLNDFKHKVEKHLLLNSCLPDNGTEERKTILLENLLKEKRKRYPQITMEQAEKWMKPVGDKLPNFFYYAVPEGLLEPDEVPPYAGLIHITTYKDGFEDQPDKWLHRNKIVRKAPQLHKTKYTDAELNLGEKFYYNMKTWQRNYREQVDYSLMYRQRLQHELDSKNREKSYDELQNELKNTEIRLRCAQDDAKYYYGMYMTMVEGADLTTIERHLMIAEIKKYNPDFNYQTIIDEADRVYGERYPSRKSIWKKQSSTDSD